MAGINELKYGKAYNRSSPYKSPVKVGNTKDSREKIKPSLETS